MGDFTWRDRRNIWSLNVAPSAKVFIFLKHINFYFLSIWVLRCSVLFVFERRRVSLNFSAFALKDLEYCLQYHRFSSQSNSKAVIRRLVGLWAFFKSQILCFYNHNNYLANLESEMQSCFQGNTIGFPMDSSQGHCSCRRASISSQQIVK